jgi:hypothetical protein
MLMNIEEIKNYIATGSRSAVCVFRECVQNAPSIVMSFYLTGRPGAYVLSVEFDPIDVIDDGEGWVWQAKPMELLVIVGLLEVHFQMSLSLWENVSRTGKLSFCDEDVDTVERKEDNQIFITQLELGKTLLPAGFNWIKSPY